MTKEAKPKSPTPRRRDEEYFHQKQRDRLGQTNIVKGTLLFVDPKNHVKEVNGKTVDTEMYKTHPNRQVVMIRTMTKDATLKAPKFDGKTRWIATSDLHHTFWSEEISKEIKREKNRKTDKPVKKVVEKAVKKAATATPVPTDAVPAPAAAPMDAPTA